MTVGSYFYKETFEELPSFNIEYPANSRPLYNKVHRTIEAEIGNTIPLLDVSLNKYTNVHNQEYISSIVKLVLNKNTKIDWTYECKNLQNVIPGMQFTLGGFYNTINIMKKGSLDRAYICGVLGHHAGANRGHGYCVVNPMASAVRYAQSQGFKKILIIDYDFHHGDGTQSIFEYDKDVKHISIHNALDLYMIKMGVAKYGLTDYGDKVGQINIPILWDKITDDQYYNEFNYTGKIYRNEDALYQLFKAIDEAENPDMIFVFDGHDGHVDDCGKSVFKWTEEDYKNITQKIVDKSINSGCPIISTLGGGYNFKSAVSSALAHYNVLKNYRI